MQNFWILMRTIINCLYPIALVFLMSNLKCTRKTALRCFVILIALAVGINTAIYAIGGQEIMMRFFAISTAIPSILLLLGLTKDRFPQLFFNFFTAINALYFVSVIGILVSMDKFIWLDVITRAVLYTIILYLFYHYFNRPYHFLTQNMQKGWATISVIPFLFFSMVMFLGLYPTVRTDNFLAVFLLYIILCFVYIVIYQVFETTYVRLIQEQNGKLLTMQLSMQQTQFAMQEKHMAEIRILRHDLRHYVQNLNTLLHEGNIKAALQILGRYETLFDQSTLPRYCENPILNAILASYIEAAEKANIQVFTQLDIPQKLPVDAVALSVVFANAIENARQACEKISDSKKRRMEIRCISRPHFIFDITNTYEGEVHFDENHLPIATQKNHGFGTQSIVAFANKHHALLDYTADNGIFRLRMMLQNY